MKRLKTYFTFLHRNKLFTAVNVAGLGISLMFVLLIADMIMRQFTVEKGQRDTERIYVYVNEHCSNGHYLMGEKLKSRYPEIEDWCAYTGNSPVTTEVEGHPMSVNTLVTRKNFFEFFSYRLLEGTPAQVLVDDHSIVLTRACANKLFGTSRAVGKTLKLQDVGNETFTVTGVVEDFNNMLISEETEAVIPYENMHFLNESIRIDDETMGNATSAVVFFRTVKGADLNAKAPEIARYLKESWWIYQRELLHEVRFIPFKKFYFYTDVPCYTEINQYNFTMVIIFLSIGILILLMATCNYMAMNVAQTSYRAKEMATRRLLGSSRPDIFWRMIGEAFILTSAAFLIGFLLAMAAEPVAMELLDVRLDLAKDLNALTLLSYALLISVLAFLSGFTPATILSNYNPLDVVKGTFRRKTKAVYLRGLGIVQSGLSIAMLACAFYLSTQIFRILHEPLGYEYGNILCFTPAASHSTLLTFREEARKLPFVKRVSFAQGTPVDGGNNSTRFIPLNGTVKEMSFQEFRVDSAFIGMFKIQVTEDRHMPYDKSNWLISEQAMQELQGTGNSVRDERGRGFNIAGQFKDFHIRSVMHPQHPLLMQIAPSDSLAPWTILAETQDGDLAGYRRQLEALYSRIVEGVPFSTQWYGDRILDLYKDIIRMNKLIIIFTCAALVISLLGLTAMNLYFITQRKRDMAVRKVFGSDSAGELARLLKFSVSSLAVSLLPAVPLMVCGIRSINRVVAYESGFPWWIPAAAFIAVTLISLGSVFLISRKAVHENPITNLKAE